MSYLIATLFDPVKNRRVDVAQEVSAEHDNVWMWTEGNYGCDCNRYLFIARALGEPEPDPNPCGETVVLERITIDGRQEFPLTAE